MIVGNKLANGDGVDKFDGCIDGVNDLDCTTIGEGSIVGLSVDTKLGSAEDLILSSLVGLSVKTCVGINSLL
jgi:hypothetical protein